MEEREYTRAMANCSIYMVRLPFLVWNEAQVMRSLDMHPDYHYMVRINLYFVSNPLIRCESYGQIKILGVYLGHD